MRKILISLSFAAVAPIASAQTLYALEDGGAGQVRVHEIFLNCTPLNLCPVPPTALPGPIPTGQGGIGWSGMNLLVTDGVTLATVDPSCNRLQACAVRGMGVLRDIAVEGPRNLLHFTDGGSLGSVPIGCPMGGLAPTRRATVPAPLQMPATAVDVDSVTGNLWVCDAAGTVAEVTFPSAWSAAVVRSFPAASLPSFPPPVLPIQAMVFDRCAQRVYLADSSGTVIHMDLAGNARGQCRPAALAPGAFFVGLARRPVRPVPVTGACAPPGASACSPRPFTTGGDPVIPNPNLRIEVTGAPMPSQAILLLDLAPGQLQLGLCAPLQLAGTSVLQVAFRGPVLNDLNGTVPCHGRSFGFLPVPNNPGICGTRVYAQWAFLDPAGLVTLSDALIVQID